MAEPSGNGLCPVHPGALHLPSGQWVMGAWPGTVCERSDFWVQWKEHQKARSRVSGQPGEGAPGRRVRKPHKTLDDG